YKGPVCAVNPTRTEIFGLPCHASIGAVPETVDLVVVVTPANTVPGIVSECLRAETKSVVGSSAGFKEKGPEDAALEKQIQSELKGGKTRLIGPNCLGLMNPLIGLNAPLPRDITL